MTLYLGIIDGNFAKINPALRNNSYLPGNEHIGYTH